jgi:AcrR family transcriptional regulator
MALPHTELHVRETRERIIAEAERQFAELGPDKASLRSIARAIGWTAASLYRYFPNKEALLAATRAAVLNRFSDRIEAAYAAAGGPWERSRAISQAYAGFAFDEPHAYHLMFGMAAPDSKPPELIDAEARSLRTVTDYVQDMIDAGLLEGEAEQIGRAYWAALHGLIMLRMSGRIASDEEFERLRRETMRLITRGARTDAAGSIRTPA